MIYNTRSTTLLLTILAAAGCGYDGPRDVIVETARPDEEPVRVARRVLLVEDLWYDVQPERADLNRWRAKWEGQIEEVKMIGGCNCHVTQFRVCATRAAIEAFPKYDVKFTGD